MVKPNESDVYIYYSGHGSMDLNSKKAHLIPVDVDPNRIAVTAYSIERLYTNLSQLPARSVTVILECCFSGPPLLSAQEDKPVPQRVFWEADVPILESLNSLVMSACRSDEVAITYPKMQHGMFTYHLLKALSIEGIVKDRELITVGDVRRFLNDPSEGVAWHAFNVGAIDQHPQIVGAKDDRALVLVD